MPRVLAPGTKVAAYEIVRLLSNGAFALAYEARSGRDRVFLKQYKMPTVTTPWYRAFTASQAELKRRVETTRLRNYCYRFVEFFEHTVGAPCYFQVFEFVERGHDLRGVLKRLRERPGSINWSQRVVFAKVMMAGIAALHEARVVHTDLKPENIQLIEATHIEAGYLVKLIDMDFSVLEDRDPPWKGDPDFGAVGTPGYFSPEHLKGQTPGPASDVFTCGLMLYELLSGVHPYAAADEDGYRDLVLNEKASPPKLAGRMPAPATDAAVEATIRRCLARDSAKRPTALEVNRTLNGVAAPGLKVAWTCPRCGVEGTRALRKCDACGHAEFGTLVLRTPGTRNQVSFRIDSVVGRDLLGPLVGADRQYLASRQFEVKRDSRSGSWVIVAIAEARNRTLLNGLAVGHAPESLHSGATISVGREGVARLDVAIEY